MRTAPADPERLVRYRRGWLSEWIAAALLIAKGYRILGRRVRTPYGEIDLIAVRGARIAFVEVKRRRTQADAQAALTTRQAVRMARAAQFWVNRHARYTHHQQGFDAVLVVPGHLPQHLRDALHMTFPDLAKSR